MVTLPPVEVIPFTSVRLALPRVGCVRDSVQLAPLSARLAESGASPAS
jgi:hypothetical protein